MIPSKGLSFTSLLIPPSKTIYLYLDLTTYEALNNQTYPVRSLSVIVNGRNKRKISFRQKELRVKSYMIPIDPVECPSGRINITLILIRQPMEDSGEYGMFFIHTARNNHERNLLFMFEQRK